jgi:hypothetical protein
VKNVLVCLFLFWNTAQAADAPSIEALNSMTRSHWSAQKKATRDQKGFAKVSLIPPLETLSRDLSSKHLKLTKELVRFWVRISPCLDGEDAELSSVLFAKWLEENPELFLNSISEEAKAWEKLSRPRDECIKDVAVGDNPLISIPVEMALQSFDDQRLPDSVHAAVEKLKAKPGFSDQPLLWKFLLGP